MRLRAIKIGPAVLLAGCLSAAVLTAAPAGAVVNGEADGDRHPNVGGLLRAVSNSDGKWVFCSGTLVSPRVVVTAAHCGFRGTQVSISFDSVYSEGSPTHSGTLYAHPGFSQVQSDSHDLAVVVLDEPVTDITPAALPAAGSLSNLPAKQQFTSVGFGASEVTTAPGGHLFTFEDARRMATGTLNATTAAWLRISQNSATGDGGTCYGDSGGPNFLGDSAVVASITISGDAVCRATNVTYRLDTPQARAFLGQFVALP